MKKLIILGAGANVDFGFPTGMELSKAIHSVWMYLLMLIGVLGLLGVSLWSVAKSVRVFLAQAVVLAIMIGSLKWFMLAQGQILTLWACLSLIVYYVMMFFSHPDLREAYGWHAS